MSDLVVFQSLVETLLQSGFVLLMLLGTIMMTWRIGYWVIIHLAALFIADEGRRRVFLATRLEE